MARLSNILRFIIHSGLVFFYGLYLKEVISFPYLFFSFILLNLLAYILFKLGFRSLAAIPLILFFPWLVRSFVIAINLISPSFIQISFDMNFYLILFPIYISSLLFWFSIHNVRFRKYEVLLNGFFLFLLFWKQSNYKITLVPNPAYLALFAIIFLLLELLVLFLSISMERKIKRNFTDGLKEFSLFFLLLTPLIFYFLLPLWQIYEEGSVAGGGGLLKSSMFRFDFSEYIKLETEISMSDDLVLMYRKEGPAERLLLRRYVLSGYEKGQGFYRDDIDKTNPPDKLIPRFTEYEDPEYQNRELVNQELFLVNIDPTVFMSLNHPVNSQPIYNWDNSSFVRIYKSEAMVSTLPIREIDPLIEMEDDIFEHYTYTQEDEEIKLLAENVTGDVPGSLLKAMTIEKFFHNNYFYSLKPGVAPDGDQLSYFINETNKGYCSYFAFSMALMCRSLGIPARVAVGFWVDPDVSVLNFYPVRADQAHAWVEIYFNDYGWIEFDPTSSTMFPGEQYPFASFTIDEFSPLIEEILENELIPENLQNSAFESEEEKVSDNPFALITDFVSRWWYLLLFVFYTVYVFGVRYFYFVLFRLFRVKRTKARFLYLSVRSRLSFERKRYRESVSEYAERIEQKYGLPVVVLTELYLKSVFSRQFTNEDLKELMLRESMFKVEFNKKIGPAKRWILFLFPFFRSMHK